MNHKHSSALAALLAISCLSAPAAVTGHWDFNSGDLSATVGTALEYLDGAGGATQTGTAFDSTTAFGIPDVGGQPAQVVRFPKMAPAMGYLMTHGAAPNGGGTRVNQYTLILDVLYPADSSGKWRSITQTDNLDDGDFFLNTGNGIGISGDYGGSVTPDTWHRLVFAVDLTRTPPVVSKFIDGVKVADQALGEGVDGRWALLPTIYFLNDNDNESELGYLNSLQVRDVKLSDAFIALLGGPSADGIPLVELPEHPYVDATTPPDGATSVSVETAIGAVIVDGQNPVRDDTIQLSLNGMVVTHTLTEDGYTNFVVFQPPEPLVPGSTNTALLTFSDGTDSFSKTWTFVVRTLAQPRGISGQWDFDLGDLSATVGAPLEYLDGANGLSAAATQFGTTTSFGIADLAGAPAQVLRFGGAWTNQIGYLMRHGAVPNGTNTATKVNQWTLIMDILFPPAEGTYFSFIQINNLDNSGDGDLFANFSGDNAGIGIGGEYSGANSIVVGRWHRVAFAVDMAAEAPVISKFIDGMKFADQPRTGSQLDGRHAMAPYALLFADEDGESRVAYVNSVQVRNYKMRDQEIAALGGPSPYGIPTVCGQWDFESGNLAATIGTDLSYPNEDTSFFTEFTGGVIGNEAAFVMSFFGAGPDFAYVIPHGALPNDGGQYVNQFTLIMDLMFPSTSTGYRALWQTDTNFPTASDADLFVDGNNGLGISSRYNGTMTPDQWHRVAFTFDLTKRELGKFLDGTNVLTGPVGSPPLGTGPYQYLGSGVDSRWSLYETALLFADEDGEQAPGFVNSIQFRVGVLSPEQIRLLGGPSAAGIPINVPVPLPLKITRIESIAADTLRLTVEVVNPGANHRVEETASLSNPTWTDVPDVNIGVLGENLLEMILPAPGAGSRFYRVVQDP